MKKKLVQLLPIFLAAAFLFSIGFLAGCAPAAAPAAEMPAPAAPAEPGQSPTESARATEAPAATAAEQMEAPAAVVQPTAEPEQAAEAPLPTLAPLPTMTAAPQATNAPASPLPTLGQPAPTQAAAPTPELRVVELEWPQSLRLGESDVIRLSLIPSEDGYTASAEFVEHSVASQDVEVPRPEGYTLRAAARLDGPAFEVSPSGEQSYIVSPGEAVTWRWSLSPRSPGRQRVSIRLLLRWEPQSGQAGPARESIAYDRALEIRVASFLGLGKNQAAAAGFGGLGLSVVLGAWAWRKPARKRSIVQEPNSGLAIEAARGMTLNTDETRLMQTVFKKYRRLVLVREFLSGYSGSRTFLARPVLPGGQADADTIIKIGPRRDIEAEYEHYEEYVKDRLPPITARIQSAPAVLRGGNKAGLRYTCISEPGKSPVSLRQALLERSDPGLIRRLFDSFGPYWWMQRRPHTFRMAEEYDRLLPPHVVLEPLPGGVGRPQVVIAPDAELPEDIRSGMFVTAGAFRRFETRADARSLTLFGEAHAGSGRLRVRWLGLTPPNATPARVVAMRQDLFREYTAGLDLFGLPDPLAGLDAWLQETVAGTRSIIHGDLNLENILVGPGDLVWLIDFAQTREGHPLFDFSHLASELIGHVLVERYATAWDYLAALRRGNDPLLGVIHEIAATCLFNSNQPREYHLALTLACLGALKYQNLSQKAKQFLFLTAAFTSP